MACPDEHSILRLVCGELPRDTESALLGHVDQCAACRRLVALVATSSLAAPSNREPEAGSEEGPGAGRYLVEAISGAGAMGIVYRAHDRQLNRPVALKVLRPGAGSTARLVQEAQTLAQLNHPNVVAVYDAGATAESAFVAMELIDGANLSTWLQQRRRTWQEVLRVFVAAGRGLLAAHAVGIVHRDFKPHNVMVAKDGRVCITDFGLATRPAGGFLAGPPEVSLGAEQASPSIRELAGTPVYMAPEQLKEQRADVASDLFSFSVSLYESLYGRRPYTLKQLGGADRPPEPPVGSGVPAWVWRALRSGLSLDPRARPQLGEFIQGLDPARRRRRNVVAAWVLATGSSAALAAVGWGVAFVAPSSRACAPTEALLEPVQRERLVRALAERPQSAALAKTVLGKFDELAHAWQRSVDEGCAAWKRGESTDALYEARRLCLTRQREQVSTWLELLASDPGLAPQFLSDPSGQPGVACEDAETLLRVEPAPPTADRERVAQLERQLAALRSFWEAGKYEEGDRRGREAEGNARELGHVAARAEALYWLGSNLTRLGRLDEGRASLQEAAALALTARHYEYAARAWLQLAYCALEYAGDAKDAAVLLRQVEGLLVGVKISGQQIALERALGQLRRHQGDYAAALAHYQQALSLQQARYGATHPEVSNTLNNVGRTLFFLGRFEESADVLREALRIQEQFAPVHPNTAVVQNNLGNALKMMGRTDEALAAYKGSVAMYRQVYPPKYVEQFVPLGNSAATLSDAGRYDEALAVFDELLRESDDGKALRKVDQANTRNNLGVLYRHLGELERAEATHRRALDLRLELFGPEHPETATSYLNLGLVQRSDRRLREAQSHLERALAVFEKRLGEQSERGAYTLAAIAGCMLDLGRFAEAERWAARAVAVWDARKAGDTPERAEAHLLLGKARLASLRHREALPELQRAWRDLEGAEADPVLRADAAFALAQALAAEEGRCGAAARGHAERAARLVEKSSPRLLPNRATILAFMRSRCE